MGAAQRKLQESRNSSDANRIDELEKQVERLSFVLSGAGVGSWDWNLLDNSVSFDDRWCTMLGLDPATVPQNLSSWESRVHPEDLPACYAAIQAHVQGKTERYENIQRIRHVDGHWVWILDRGMVTERDKLGQAVRFSGVHIDITLQKDMESKLLEARQKLEFALQGAGMGLWDWNLDDNSVIYDTHWFSLLGLDPATTPPNFESWSSRIHPSELPICLEEIRAHLEGKKDRIESVHRMQHSSGRWIWTLDRGRISARDRTGRPTRVSGILFDITLQKEAEENLRLTQERLDRVLDAAGVGIWDWNLEDNSVQYDLRYLRMLGINPGTVSMTLATWEQRVHPEDRDRVLTEAQAHIARKTPHYSSIFRMRHSDGRWLWIQSLATVIEHEDNKKPVRFIGIHIDITRQHEAEEKLRDAQRELERQRAFNIHASRMATVGEMAGGIAHEINSPLAVITTLAGQLQEYAGTPHWTSGQTRTASKRILETSHRISQIISTVLGMARQAPTDPMVLSSVQKIIDDAYSLCRERFHLAGIRFESSVQPAGLTIVARPNEITQIILNLLQNSRDAVLSKNEGRWIHVDACLRKQDIEIRVADSGGPIPESVRRRLFEPFFTTKPPQQGTGLGLSISQKIIETHGGTLQFDERSPDTCFVIHLPLPPKTGGNS